VEVQSLDAHFVAMVDNLDGPVILKLNELVVERNFRDVYLYLNAVRLPQRPDIVNSPSTALGRVKFFR